MSNVSEIQRLEDRRLFASTLLADVSLTSRGTLTIQGTINADTIAVSKDDDTVTVVVRNGAGDTGNFTFAADRVGRLYVEGAAGKDRIELDGDWTRPATLVGGAGKDTLLDLTSTDKMPFRPFVFSGGAGNDLIEIVGPVRRVDGGAGIDHLSAPAPAPATSFVTGTELTITSDSSSDQPDGIFDDGEPVNFRPRFLVTTDSRTGRALFNAEAYFAVPTGTTTIGLPDDAVIGKERLSHPRGG